MGFLPTRLRGSRTICSEYETRKAQYAYRRVVLPDLTIFIRLRWLLLRLNAPTGAWCSLTPIFKSDDDRRRESQCTYRCVVLPDGVFSGLGGLKG